MQKSKQNMNKDKFQSEKCMEKPFRYSSDAYSSTAKPTEATLSRENAIVEQSKGLVK